MDPHKMNKIDISQMSPQEQNAFKLYGKLPAKNALTKMLKDRKYFDSGDYMMYKAGVRGVQHYGSDIPTPQGVTHLSPPGPTSPGHASPPTSDVPPPLYPSGSAIIDDSAPSAHAHSQPIGVPGQPQSFGAPGQAQPIGSPGQAQPFGVPGQPQPVAAPGQPQPIGIPGQPQPFHPHHRGSVGVGISPADTSDAMDMPHINHFRRQSESHRLSPPGILRDANTPSSSFPIQHHGNGYGSSPVKASSLAKRLDEDMEG